VSSLPRRYASTLASLVFISFAAAVTLPRHRALASYALSFWHYYVYWLAFRHGAIAHDVFKLDALLLKSVSIVALGAAYIGAATNPMSLAVVAAGFLLNIAAARVLGADRTYYGQEVAGLPHQHITTFPYSWISHPMLVGNVIAFGGTLLNPGFRREWWPLAVAHVVLNLALLLMETWVTPLRRSAIPGPQDGDVVRRPAQSRLARWTAYLAGGAGLGALTGAAAGAWGPWAGHRVLGASLGAATAVHAVVISFCYTLPSASSEDGRGY
jgi:Phospholipid methyltransferase